MYLFFGMIPCRWLTYDYKKIVDMKILRGEKVITLPCNLYQ